MSVPVYSSGIMVGTTRCPCGNGKWYFFHFRGFPAGTVAICATSHAAPKGPKILGRSKTRALQKIQKGRKDPSVNGAVFLALGSNPEMYTQVFHEDFSFINISAYKNECPFFQCTSILNKKNQWYVYTSWLHMLWREIFPAVWVTIGEHKETMTNIK